MNEQTLNRLKEALGMRNPLLITKLNAGIPEIKIKKKLERAEVKGATEPLIWLYSWADGVGDTARLFYSKAGFFPKQFYLLLELNMAIADFKGFKEIADAHPDMPQLFEAAGCFFPIFLGGHSGAIWIAVDITPGKHNRIMINDRVDQGWREAYSSFEEFIADLIRANEKDDSLRCFSENE